MILAALLVGAPVVLILRKVFGPGRPTADSEEETPVGGSPTAESEGTNQARG